MNHGSLRWNGEAIARGFATVFALAWASSPLWVTPCGHGGILTSLGGAHCERTFQVEAVLSAAALGVVIALWFTRRSSSWRSLGVVLVVLAGLGLAAPEPWAVGLCRTSSMPCHHSAQWIWLWAALTAIDGLWILLSPRPEAQAPSNDPWEAAQQSGAAAGS